MLEQLPDIKSASRIVEAAMIGERFSKDSTNVWYGETNESD